MGADAPIEHDCSWPVVFLAEIATKIGSGATPRGGSDAYLPSRTLFALVRSQNVFDRRFDRDGLAFISGEQADGLRGVILQSDDILLNITGDGITFGRACIVPPEVLPACVNQHVSIIRLDAQRANAGYVLAFLTHPDVKSYIESFNAGGSRRAITKGHIESFRVPLPPLHEQLAIARILGTLDDKIELNRRMNETLEAMARALFKSWFVDFDPVRAKAEGRDPGLPKTLADLFPDSFENSELGEIPNGWRHRKLGELVDLTRGRTYKGSLKGLSGPVLLGLASIERNGGFRNDKLSTYGGDSPPNLILIPDDLFASLKDVTQSADLLGAVARVPAHVAKGRLTQDTVKLTFRTSTTSRKIVYCTLLTPQYRDYCRAHATGTTNLGLSREDFLAYPVVQPGEAVQQAFDAATEIIDSRASRTMSEARTLAALRDALTPKLISGELRVKDT